MSASYRRMQWLYLVLVSGLLLEGRSEVGAPWDVIRIVMVSGVVYLFLFAHQSRKSMAATARFFGWEQPL